LSGGRLGANNSGAFGGKDDATPSPRESVASGNGGGFSVTPHEDVCGGPLSVIDDDIGIPAAVIEIAGRRTPNEGVGLVPIQDSGNIGVDGTIDW